MKSTLLYPAARKAIKRTFSRKRVSRVPRVDHIIDEGADRFMALSQGGRLRGQMVREIGDLEAKVFVDLVERFDVVRFRVEKRDLDRRKRSGRHKCLHYSV